MKNILISWLVVVLLTAGCTKSQPSAGENRSANSPGFIEESPHVNTGTGGIGSGPTGTGGSEPADHNPLDR